MGDQNTSCKNQKTSCVPTVLDACYSFKNGESEILDGFKGRELSEAMDCTQNVALNKLNPQNEHNTPTLKDAVKLTDHFDDDRILQAWASERGYLLVAKVNPDDIDEEEILDAMLNLNANFGDLGHAYHTARADGVIDPQEFQKIKGAALLLRTSVALLENILETQVRELPGRKGAIIDG